MRPLLVLRAEPGATATVERARAMGREVIAAPLFVIAPAPFTLPERLPPALLLTSANAARALGEAGPLAPLPAYAVGAATAEAARLAGFRDIRTGSADAAAIVARAAGEGVTHLLHLAGRDHRAIKHPGVTIARIIVYEARQTANAWPGIAEALRIGAIPLLHSPRAARAFAYLFDENAGDRSEIALAAISAAAADAAGAGWRGIAVASVPADAALLDAALALDRDGRPKGGGRHPCADAGCG